MPCRRKLHAWFPWQGVSEGSATQTIRLCEDKYLQAQRRPLLEIGEGNLVFGSTAGICGTKRLRGCWGGARGSNFHRWSWKSYAPTFIQLLVKMMKKLARARSRPSTSRDLSPLFVEDIAAIENATTEVELFGTQLNSTPLRRSTRRRGAGTTAIQGTQDTHTPMPLNEVPNGIGPPPPDSLTATRGMSHRHFLQILFFAPLHRNPLPRRMDLLVASSTLYQYRA